MNPLSIRRLHSYLGLLIAPSVLFFAITGALQVFSLHEAHGHYRPYELIEKLSSVHKDQVFAFGNHHEAAADEPSGNTAVGSAPSGEAEDEPSKPATLILKSYFCMVGVALTLSSALGLWIGLTQTRSVRLAWTLVLAGTLIPLALAIA